MTRVAAVTRPRGLTRLIYRIARRDFGRVPAPLEVFALHPRLMYAYSGIEFASEHSRLVDERLKALAATKAATVAACEYCVDISSWIAREAGLTEAQLRALPNYRGSDEFSELEKLVLDYTVGMTRTPIEVPDELYAALSERFSDAQLVELTAAIALENFRARFNHALAIEPDGYSEGAFCAIPERPPVDGGGGSGLGAAPQRPPADASTP